MNMRNLIPAGYVLLLCGLGATPITINNAGFENGSLPLAGNGFSSQVVFGSALSPSGGTLPDWTWTYSSLDTAAGLFAPSPGGNNWTSTWWSGNNIGYLQVTDGFAIYLAQTLNATLMNDSTYTFSALIGNRSFSPYANYSLQLLAGGTLLASSGNNAAASGNTSGFDSLIYNSGAANPFAGQTLSIRIQSIGAAGSTRAVPTEVFFDDISLDVVSNSSSAVPEPSTWAAACLGLAGIVLSRRPRQRSN